MLGLIAVGMWLIAMVFKPLFISLLLSASIASLTFFAIYKPIHTILNAGLSRICSEASTRHISAILATITVAGVLISPLVFLIAGILGSFSAITETVYGFITNDPERMGHLFTGFEQAIGKFNSLYPSLAIPDHTILKIETSLKEIISEARHFGPSFMRYLWQGSGHIAQYVLALISLAFFFAHGPRLIHSALKLTPLEDEQILELKRNHRAIVFQLLTDTIGLAVARGLLLGGIARLCSPDYNPVIIASLAAFLSLLPVVGFSLVWLPIAWLSWQQGHYLTVAVISASGLLIDYGLLWVWSHLGHRVNARHSWLSFGLFLGLIGGMLTFGTKGLIIGPMAVVFTSTFTRFWLPLYGVEPAMSDETDITQVNDSPKV